MAASQSSKLDHSDFTCFECGEEKSKSEVSADGFKYVCGDCQ